MAFFITSFSPTSYTAGQAKSALISFTDDSAVFFNDGSTWYYTMGLRLYSTTSSTTSLGNVGSVDINLGSNYEDDGTYADNDIPVTITIPSAITSGTYYIGGTSLGGSRAAVTVATAPSGITISFNLNGGSGAIPNSITQTGGTSFTMPTSANFSRTGYTFLGWSTSSTATTASYLGGESYTFNSSTLLYAVWRINSYTVSFNSNGGTSVSSKTQNYGTSVTAPTDPTRNGYTFNSWYYNTSLTSLVTFPFSMPAFNRTLYAKWRGITYVITYVLNGGTNNASNPTIYTTGNGANFFDPTKFGYTFNGWYTTSNFSGSPISFLSTTAYGDVTLYAKWTINSYNISFVSNGGSTVNSLTRDYDSSVTAPTNPTRSGYNFEGWYYDIDLTQAVTFPFNMPNNDLTLYADWSLITYNITYVLNNGINNASNVTSFNVTTETFSILDATREGHAFSGWYASSDFSGSIVTQIVKGSVNDRILYAKWVVNSYTISFVSNGGTSVSSITQNYDTTLTPPTAPSKIGYYFGAWYTEPELSSSYTFPAKMPALSFTLYASWIIRDYNITYNLNGGTNDGNNPTTYTIEDSALTIADPTRFGYTFGGWFDNSGFTGNAITSIAAGSSGDKTFYAKWTANEHVLKFINVSTTISSNVIAFDTDIVAPSNPTRIDPKYAYLFVGWNTNPEALSGDAIASANLGKMPNNDVTYYAIYKRKLNSLKKDGKNVNLKLGSLQIQKIVIVNEALTETIVLWENEYPE